MQSDIQLNQEIEQKIALSAEMKQSLAVLAMSAQALKELLSEAMMTNPVLEEMNQQVDEQDDWCQTISWEEVSDSVYGISDSDFDEDRPGLLRYEQIEYAVSTGDEESFSGMLEKQLWNRILEPEMIRLCKYMILSLDSRGYLELDPVEIASAFEVSTDRVLQALHIIQSLQPTGVGARSIQECLLLQLAASDHFDTPTALLISEGLPLLAANNIQGIMNLLQVSRKQAIHCCHVVRHLNPIPAQGFDTGEKIAYIVPDAMVMTEGDEVTVCLNSAIQPSLAISRMYSEMARSSDEDEVKQYLSSKIRDAQALLSAVQERNRTLLKVIRFVADYQRAFLADGVSLRPLTLHDVAESVGLHVSTISRTIQNKYILTRTGTVSLKSLFSTGIKNEFGEKVSAALICRKISQLVHSEELSNPMSDTDLCVALAKADITISRRTVTKYRLSLGIASSTARKVQNG